MLKLVAKGYIYREIGEKLFISTKTVPNPRGEADALARRPAPAFVPAVTALAQTGGQDPGCGCTLP